MNNRLDVPTPVPADTEFALSFVGIDAELWDRPWAVPTARVARATRPAPAIATPLRDHFLSAVTRVISESRTQL